MNDKPNYETRLAQAQETHRAGLARVKNKPEPDGQKFPRDTRVRIADDLGPSMSHFTKGCLATVRYTYAHAYGGTDVKNYCLDVDGDGESSWYHEHQLSSTVD